jgi:hypothetical protein
MKWFALVAAVIATTVYGWSAAMPSRDAHRFRLTVEVDTPDGPRGGSRVIEVERKEGRWPVPGPRHVFRVRGEAVFVDLGPGRDLVAVLAHGENAQDVSQIITLWVEAYGHSRWDEDVWSGRWELRGAVELRPPLIPTLVTFADPFDPATVRVVQPHEFEQVFGQGFRFRRATLEMLPDSVPVTRGVIERHLPWDIREWLTPRRFRRQDP